MTHLEGDISLVEHDVESLALAGGRDRLHPRSTLAAWSWEVVAVAGYAAVIVAFFWRSLAAGLVPMGYDLFAYFFPYKSYVSQSLSRGEIPLWNPLVFMGAPLLGNIQTGLLYPPNVLFYILPSAEGVTASIVLHLFMAASFTYLFCRVSLGLSVTGAWIAGAVFALGGFMGAKAGHLNQLQAAVWLPLMMLGLERGATGRTAAGIAVGAVALALQVLAGHTQQVYYSAWALGLCALYLALLGGRGGWNRLLPLAVLAAIGGLGVCIAAGQLVPAAELAMESYRAGGIPFKEAVRFSVQLPDALDTLLPYYEQVPYIELTGYTGLVALVLVPAGVAWRRQPSWPLYFAGLAVLSLVLALGDETPIFACLFEIVPGFDLFRAPGRWLFLYSFSMAVLAGMGASALRARCDQAELRSWLRDYALGIVVLVAILIALKLWLEMSDSELRLPAPRIVLAWMLFGALGVGVSLLNRAESSSRLAGVLLAALVVFELQRASVPQEYNRPVPPSIYEAEAGFYPSLSKLQPSRTLSLVDPGKLRLDEEELRAALPAHIEGRYLDEYLNYWRFKEAMMPNTGMIQGLRSLDGYDGGLLPTRRYWDLKRAILGQPEVQPHTTIRDGASAIPNARLLAVMGVSHLLLNEDLEGYVPDWQEVEPPSDEGVRIVRNAYALPRAYMVYDVRVVTSEPEVLDAVEEIDPRRTVVLTQAVEYQSRANPGLDEVRTLSDGANEVIVEVSTDQPGFLVLSDTYYPGWNAYVDGREVQLMRANYVVRAVQLDGGNHTVRFSYEPLSVRVGLGISILGLLATASLPLLRRLRPRPKLPERSVQ